MTQDMTYTYDKPAIARSVARMLLEIEAVLFRADDPFTLTSGMKSPVYIDCRKIIAFLLRREIAFTRAAHFMFVQVTGAICGAMLAHFMFEVPLLQLSQNVRTGPAQWGSEFVATFGLLTVIFGGLRWRPDAVPALVGMYITAAYWFTASTSFANPAVTIARAFTDSFSGILPADVSAFIVAQLAAAVAGAYVLGWLFKAEEA